MGSMARNLASIVTGDLEIDVRYTLAVAVISGIALGCLAWYATIDRVSHSVLSCLVLCRTRSPHQPFLNIA
jgi:hypothetical protein